MHDPELQRAVLRAFPAQAPRGVPFFIRLRLVEKADPDQFAALAGRVTIFDLQPSDGVDDTPPNDAPVAMTALPGPTVTELVGPTSADSKIE